jgi:hypothetical protein
VGCRHSSRFQSAGSAEGFAPRSTASIPATCFRFELKGATSLLKGRSLVHRFSEGIDILVYPETDELPTGKSQNKPTHIEARCSSYDGLSDKINSWHEWVRAI